MKYTIIKSLRAMFPFLLTIALWRLSSPFWNPGGILALIPVWYCVFINPVPWFGLFGALVCFLIDYKINTVCLWLILYCLFYAIYGFQTLIDLSRVEREGTSIFMIFLGIGLLLTIFTGFCFTNILRGLWVFGFSTILYMPIVLAIKRVHHD